MVQVYNQTDLSISATFASNIQAAVEIGHDSDGRILEAEWASPMVSDCYFPAQNASGSARPYPGLDDPQVLEVTLWQSLLDRDSGIPFSPKVDLSLNDTVAELLGAYNASIRGKYMPMAAIGVRCTSVSAVGIASIDGSSATFQNCQRCDSPTLYSASYNAAQGAKRLSLAIPDLLFSRFDSTGISSEWLSYFFSSVRKSQAGAKLSARRQGNILTSYLQASELKRSLIRAYSRYALTLVYNNDLGYIDASGVYEPSTSINTNATTYIQDTILVAGIVPPVIVAILLGAWALASLVLTLVYGFRRSGAASLDGLSMLRCGVPGIRLSPSHSGPRHRRHNAQVC